jgi:hypothetical protein
MATQEDPKVHFSNDNDDNNDDQVYNSDDDDNDCIADVSPRSILKKRYEDKKLNALFYDECDFCGGTENIVNHHCVPDRYGHYNFCRATKCFDYYGNFVYSRWENLTHGIPHCYKKRFPKVDTEPEVGELLQCDFCGKTSRDENNHEVMKCPFLPSYYLHSNFCKNQICCKAYREYMTDLKRIPYAIKKEILEHMIFGNTDKNDLQQQQQHHNCPLLSSIDERLEKIFSKEGVQTMDPTIRDKLECVKDGFKGDYELSSFD